MAQQRVVRKCLRTVLSPCLKMPGMTLQDMKLQDNKYRIKIDYITVQCVFLLNFHSFVCKASVNQSINQSWIFRVA